MASLANFLALSALFLCCLPPSILTAAAAAPPDCSLQTKGFNYSYNGPDIISCVCSPEEPRYIGNLNFVKQEIGSVARYPRNLEIVLSNCDSLEMELNSAELTYKQLDIKIENTPSVIINTIRKFLISRFLVFSIMIKRSQYMSEPKLTEN